MLKNKHSAEFTIPLWLAIIMAGSALIIAIALTTYLTSESWRKDAVNDGRAEYYWDAHLDKQWRWLSRDKIADEVIRERENNMANHWYINNAMGTNMIYIHGNTFTTNTYFK